MKLKSLLFGSAALLAAGTGAQAADLPIAEPVDYVRICDAFGTGFYYIPGTDTCLRVGGYVRAEAHYIDFDEDEDDINHRERNNFTTRARGALILDARTQTDLGLVRAYVQYWMTVGPGDESTIGGTATDIDEFEADGSANYGGTSPTLNQAFIQISNGAGTFTAGHAASFFDFFGSYTFGTRIDLDDNTNEANLFAYTFGGGNGFSATVSLEDAASADRRLDPGFSVDTYEGQEWPDLVGNIRIDQGWGSAQIMGVLHHIHDKEGFEGIEGEDDDDMLGWAIGAGATFSLPVGGLEASFQANYADGALGYITTDPLGVGDFNLGDDGDDIDDDNFFDGDAETNTAWNIRGGVSAGFTETITANLNGSYTDVDDEGSQDADYDFWAVVANVVWEPVPGLSMGPEIAYADAEFDDEERSEAIGDVFGAMFRINRSF